MRWNGRKGGRASRNLDSDHIDERNHSRKHGFRGLHLRSPPRMSRAYCLFWQMQLGSGNKHRALGSQERDRRGWGGAATDGNGHGRGVRGAGDLLCLRHGLDNDSCKLQTSVIHSLYRSKHSLSCSIDWGNTLAYHDGDWERFDQDLGML